ncbi:hypothetical protein OPT61_g2157 [Boeremia exigua]|uniref:Uncharacterized protein n=1 Tax=Boeremia exigua TaxID=749465 RepID=A0ACC2IMP1_9PLEO|nr:hypothetical protein OPT61_g2157 [Boeremia exigua]
MLQCYVFFVQHPLNSVGRADFAVLARSRSEGFAAESNHAGCSPPSTLLAACRDQDPLPAGLAVCAQGSRCPGGLFDIAELCKAHGVVAAQPKSTASPPAFRRVWGSKITLAGCSFPVLNIALCALAPITCPEAELRRPQRVCLAKS